MRAANIRDHLLRAIRDWQSIVVVTLVTAMLWLFAEAESLTRVPATTAVRIVDPRNERLIRVDAAGWRESAPVSITLQGPATAVQEVASRLKEGVRLDVGSAGVPNAEGEQTIDLRVALRDFAPFSESGVSVAAVDPPTLRIDLQTIETLTDVEVIPELGGFQLAEPPVVEPPRVTVRGPRESIRALRAGVRGARVFARPPAGALEGLIPGVRQTLDVRLSLPAHVAGLPGLEVLPSNARLTFTVSGQRETVTLPSAPVWIAMPPLEGERWRVEIYPEDRLVRDIQITGPRDLVNAIRDGRTPLIGIVALTSDQLEQRIGGKPIDFWEPAGVEVDGPDRPIRLTIEPRESDAATGPTVVPQLPGGGEE